MSEEWSAPAWAVLAVLGTVAALLLLLLAALAVVVVTTRRTLARTDAESDPDWDTPPPGTDGCYRVKITGEPMMHVDFVHHGEHGDHNVSGMITTAQRLVNALPAVVAAAPGLVTALDLPLVTGRGLVAGSGHRGPKGVRA